ncbi:MAG: hypothetical protein JXB10_19705 [Pirellulales bacterium]|nr:hypothetical protein [Pirellulales bacterium]
MVRACLRSVRLGFFILVFIAGDEILPNGGAVWGSIWESYSAVTSRPAAAEASAAPTARDARQTYPVDDPRLHAESFFGFPRRLDPLMDETSKPSWRPMIENRPVYDRPDYTPPDYDAPHFGLDAVRRPAYHVPLYVLPSDNKPHYDIKYAQAPGILAPTYNAPVYLKPGYIIRPYIAPAYDHKPTYEMSTIFYNRPEYQAPVYKPQEYLKPREVPPPYIKPAE